MEKKSLYVKTALISLAIFIVTLTTCSLKFGFFYGITLGASILLSGLVASFGLISGTFRCVMVIAILKLIGPQCRIVVLSIISGLLIGGPVLSIIHNLHQVQETTKCVGNLVQEHSDELRSVYTGAYRDMSERIEDSVSVWKDIGGSIENVVGPVRAAFSTAADAIRNFEKTVQNVQDNCGREINKVRNSCESKTQEAFQKCLEAIPSLQKTVVKPIEDFGQNVANGATKVVNQIGDFFTGRRKRSTAQDIQNICQPVNLGTESCKIFEGTALCAPIQGVKIPGLPSLTEKIGRVVDLFSLSVTPGSSISQNSSSTVGNVSEIIDQFQTDFNDTFSTITLVLGIIQGCFTFIPLMATPILSFMYLNNARKILGNKKQRDATNVTKFFVKDSKKERRGAGTALLLCLTHGLLTGVILCFDALLYFTQSVARDYGGTNTTVSGGLEINLDIKVGPVLQPFVDRFVQSLTFEQDYSFAMSSVKCLPDPVPSTNAGNIILISALYIVLLGSFLFQVFLGPLKQRVVLNFLNQGIKNDVNVLQKLQITDDKDKVGKGLLTTVKLNNDVIGIDKENELNVKQLNKLNARFNSGY